MKRYRLTEDHQGIPANTTITGPTKIPLKTTNGYFPEGSPPDSTFCFFESYVENNPKIFKLITE